MKYFIPNDYSRCSNTDCPFRMDCARYLALLEKEKGPRYISVTKFMPNQGGCDNQIKIEMP